MAWQEISRSPAVRVNMHGLSVCWTKQVTNPKVDHLAVCNIVQRRTPLIAESQSRLCRPTCTRITVAGLFTAPKDCAVHDARSEEIARSSATTWAALARRYSRAPQQVASHRSSLRHRGGTE